MEPEGVVSTASAGARNVRRKLGRSRCQRGVAHEFFSDVDTLARFCECFNLEIGSRQARATSFAGRSELQEWAVVHCVLDSQTGVLGWFARRRHGAN
jgi:hypothetical protein